MRRKLAGMACRRETGEDGEEVPRDVVAAAKKEGSWSGRPALRPAAPFLVGEEAPLASFFNGKDVRPWALLPPPIAASLSGDLLRSHRYCLAM